MKTTTILGLMLFMPFYLFSQCQIDIEFDDSEPFCGELPEAIDLLTYSDNGDPECSEIDYFEYEWSISIPGEGYSELGEQGPITSFSEVLLDPSFNNPYDNVNWIGLRLSAFNENGEAVFTFENIMLPDSSADLEGSQGFVTYNIQLLDPLAHDTQISNQAEIYFDQNPAIITNQEQHHVFECNTLQIPVAIGGFVLCEGDSLYADFGQDYVDTYEIIVQGTTYTNETGDFEILPTETGMSTVEMTVMNPICTNSITTQLNVLTPPDAEILEEDGTLYAENGIAFVWLLDGETVAQGLSNEYTPTESGEYQVIVADLTGCATISEPFDFVVGISESSIQDIKVFPNPAYDVIQFELPNANWTVQIRDSRGVLIQESEANGGTNRVALNDYANGMYFIIMSDGDGALLRSTFIKK